MLNSNLCNAGVPNVIMEIVNQLHDVYDFDIFLHTNNICIGEYEGIFQKYGGKIFKVQTIEYEQHKVLFFLNKRIISKSIKRILKNNKYDVIHCHNGINSGIVLRIASKQGIPILISHAHGNYSRKGRNFVLRYYNYINKKWIAKYSTKRLACSDLSGRSLFGDKEFVNVLNPVNIDYYNGIIHNIHDSINLIQIGYFCDNKNQLFSLRVLNSLIEMGINAKLDFIGFSIDTLYDKKLENYVLEHNLKEHVRFLDKNVNKRICFSSSDFLLLPSRSEGLPLTVLEAQSADVRCVVSESVSRDCDCGLVQYISTDNERLWADYIKNNLHTCYKKNIDKLNQCNTRNYSYTISKFYNEK